jgi:addiction module HigA family antidote
LHFLIKKSSLFNIKLLKDSDVKYEQLSFRLFHPGDLVRLKLLILEVSISRATKELQISKSTFSKLLNRKAKIDAVMALRLSIGLGGSPEEWLSHQNDHDLCIAKSQFPNLGIKRLKGNHS